MAYIIDMDLHVPMIKFAEVSIFKLCILSFLH